MQRPRLSTVVVALNAIACVLLAIWLQHVLAVAVMATAFCAGLLTGLRHDEAPPRRKKRRVRSSQFAVRGPHFQEEDETA